MDVRKRNIRLLIILGVLALTSLTLYFIPKEKKSTIDNVAFFQLADTATIDKITIESEDLNNTLVRTDTGWVINGKMKADENIMMVLLTVMKQVEVLRPIPESQAMEMENTFSKNAMQINFYRQGNLAKSFQAGSNDTQTLSIFKSDVGDYYVVNLPGYDSYVSGIFEISEIDWKDRLVVNVTPTSLSQMSVLYYNDPDKDFTVEVAGNIPLIPDVESLDTLALMDYLDQFLYFQADRFVDPAKKGKYDSLVKTNPFAKFSFDYLAGNSSLTFYPKLPGESEVLGVTEKGELALFEDRRIQGIFKSRDFFRKKE